MVVKWWLWMKLNIWFQLCAICGDKSSCLVISCGSSKIFIKIVQAFRQHHHCCRDACQISKRYHFFQIPIIWFWNLTKSLYWILNGTQIAMSFYLCLSAFCTQSTLEQQQMCLNMKSCLTIIWITSIMIMIMAILFSYRGSLYHRK